MRATTKQGAEARTTRDVILDVAERHFAERGFSGVSVRQIATDAGLKNQASLYHHFKNKKALYEATISRGVGPLIDMVAASRSIGQPTDPVLDGVVDYLADHPNLPRLIQRVGLDDSKYLRDTVARLIGPLYSQGVKVLAGTGGNWPSSEMPHLAVGLFHLIFGYFANATLLEAVLPEDPQSPAAVARQRRFLKTAVARLLGDDKAPKRRRR